MYYFIRFTNEDGRNFVMYEGNSFVAFTSENKANEYLANSLAVTLSCKDTNIVKMSLEQLEKAIGGIPYKILDFFGMGRKWEGVEIK